MAKKVKYKVRSHIQDGVKEGGYHPGDEIELTEDQAMEIRHALVDPPSLPNAPGAVEHEEPLGDEVGDDDEGGDEEETL